MTQFKVKSVMMHITEGQMLKIKWSLMVNTTLIGILVEDYAALIEKRVMNVKLEKH